MRKFGLYIVLGLVYPIAALPLKVHYAFAGFVAWLLHKVLRYRYAEVVANIARACDDITYREIKQTAGKFYRHLAIIVVESIWSIAHSSKQIGKRIVIENGELLNQLAKLDKGIIAVAGHTGSWEMFYGMPNVSQAYGVNIDNANMKFIFKRQHNKFANDFIKYIRTKHESCTPIEAGEVLRYILKNPHGQDVFYLLCDQSPSGGDSHVLVDFLNQKTYLIDGPEKIAAKMKMPVVYCGLHRDEKMRNVASFELITEDASQHEKGWVTREYAKLLERDINKYKEQWLWSHRRWKKRVV